MAHQIREQLYYFVLFLNNLFYNLLPFFCIKTWYLRAIGVRIGRYSYIHPWVTFTHPGRLVIGDNSTINYGCLLDTRCGIEIGSNVMIGHRCRIYTLGHDLDDEYFRSRGGRVKIEDHVVLFTNILVMPKVTIHEGAAVLPGSVVTKDVGPYDVVGGNPARFIRKRSNKINYKIRYGYWFGI